jgi:hypothetical protein
MPTVIYILDDKTVEADLGKTIRAALLGKTGEYVLHKVVGL